MTGSRFYNSRCLSIFSFNFNFRLGIQNIDSVIADSSKIKRLKSTKPKNTKGTKYKKYIIQKGQAQPKLGLGLNWDLLEPYRLFLGLVRSNHVAWQLLFSERSWFFTSLYFFGKVAGWVVVVDFDSNTSTAKLWLGLGLSLATKYKIIFAVRLHVLHECLMI